MSKIIFVLLDGLSAEIVWKTMPFLGKSSLQKTKVIQSGILQTENPPLSRPLYATFFTGLSPQQTGIEENSAWQLSTQLLQQSFFAKMHQAGFTCAAAAYYWMYELYMGERFSPSDHRMYFSAKEKVIQHGIFYSEDHYPDSHVFQDATFLCKKYSPDFLLIHTMNIDDAGHKWGLNSSAYALAARHADTLLAQHVPLWLKEQYTVIVVSDHGMDMTGNHIKWCPEVYGVPFAIFSSSSAQNISNEKKLPPILSQKDWYAWLCAYFSLEDSSMF